MRIDEGPEVMGYNCGCWNTALIQGLILMHLGVEYDPHYIAQLFKGPSLVPRRDFDLAHRFQSKVFNRCSTPPSSRRTRPRTGV